MSSSTHALDEAEKALERPAKRARIDHTDETSNAYEMRSADGEEDEDATPTTQPRATRASDLYLDTVSNCFSLQWDTKVACRLTAPFSILISRKCALYHSQTSIFMAVSYAESTSRGGAGALTRMRMQSTMTTMSSLTLKPLRHINSFRVYHKTNACIGVCSA